MRQWINLVLALVFLFVLISCAEKKPEFVVSEDYSFLKGKKKKTLLLITIYVDTIQDSYGMKPDPVIRKVINNYDFKASFRWKLAKEIYNLDEGKIFHIDFSEKAEDENVKYFKYIGKKYPKDRDTKNYDVVLEISMKVLLSYELSHIDVSLSEHLRLLNPKTANIYLSSYTNRTYKSIGQKIKLKKNTRRLRSVLQHVINRSSSRIANYLMNKEKKPDYDDIAPALPRVQFLK